MTFPLQNKAIPLVRDLISQTFEKYVDADPFDVVSRVREFFFNNPEIIKNALGKKGVFFDEGFYEDFISKEISSFLAVLVMQPVNKFIDNSDFNFLYSISRSGAVSSDFVKERIYFIFKNSFDFSEAHIFLKSSCNVFHYNVLNRYMAELFFRQSRIFGLLKEEVSDFFSLQEWINFIGTVFLVRPLVYAKMSSGCHLPCNYENMDSFIKWVSKDFYPLPERIIEEAYKSFLPGHNPVLYGSLPGLIAVLDTMYRIRPHQAEYEKAEESRDRSWLAIAMINAEHYSFDKNIIEELYSIAEDKKW